MAKGRKTGGRDFKPGQSGNPSGRPELPAEIKGARVLNKLELELVLTKYLRCSVSDLRENKDNQELSSLDQIAINIILKAIDYGDPIRLNFLLDRLIGKVPQKISDPDGGPLGGAFADFIRLAVGGKL